MATAKKKTTKKSPAKKSQSKSAPVKRASRAPSVASSARSDRKFMEARFTEQTLYWILIGAAVLALAVWVLSIQVQMNDLYDAADIQNSEDVVVPEKKAPVPTATPAPEQ